MRNLFSNKNASTKNTLTPLIIYKPDNFGILELNAFLEIYFKENEKKDYRIQVFQGLLKIDLNIIHDIKKGKTSYTSYQIQSKEASFFIVAENVLEVLKPQESIFYTYKSPKG